MDRPPMADRIERLEAYLAQAMRDPSPTELLEAPFLDRWRIAESPFGFTILDGTVDRHPFLLGRLLYTSPLLRLERDLAWARTFSRFYRLGEPAPGHVPLNGEELLQAIELNRRLIPLRPTMFDLPELPKR